MSIFTKDMKPRSGESFSHWFYRQGFRNFSAQEIRSYWLRSRDSTTNSAPPRYLWHRFVPTLKILDDVRDHFNKPLTITSNYRSPAYNKAVGSSNPADPRALAGRGSQHPRFAAADVQMKGIRPRQVAELLLKWRREGKFVGGIGLYSTFVHLDTRNYNATWGF